VIASDTRGIQDYVADGKSGFLCGTESQSEFAAAILHMKNNAALRMQCGDFNRETVKAYCLGQVKEEVLNLFSRI